MEAQAHIRKSDKYQHIRQRENAQNRQQNRKELHHAKPPSEVSRSSDDSKADEVGMNNTVTVYVEEDDCEETYRIVTTVRSNSLENLISIESPMGKALMRHKVGDRVEIRVSDNYSYFVVIRKIDKTNDDSEDKIRSY